ncbi:MAG TPA: DUF4397 domain-containing protein [Mucilaginibacter sp.]|jgi:hypothetical protein|nr:DUF4397 domain-containing protein [Mucilaginibacter sp.]
MNVKPLLFILCAVIFYSTACKKNNDAPTINTSIDSLNFINAYSIPVNIYLNGSRLNKNSNLAAAGSSGYYTVPFGSQIQVKKVFDPSTSVVQTLFNYSPKMVPHQYYSLFIAGATDSNAFVTQDVLPLGDTATSKCQVRFVNASPDAGPVDFFIGGVKYNNLKFKQGSAFAEVDTASLSPIMVFKAGTTDTLINGQYPLLQGYIYTFYTMGSLTGKGSSALGVGVTVNAP